MSPLDPIAASDALTVRLNNSRLPKGGKKIKSVVVKQGPQTFKSVSLLEFGKPDSDEVTKRELRVQSWKAKQTGSGIDFTETENAWHCEDEEIDKLAAFVSGEASEEGRYRRVGNAASQIIDAIEAGNVSADDLVAVLTSLLTQPKTTHELAQSDPAEKLAAVVGIARHSKTLDELDVLLADESVTETNLQAVLEKDWWIFGGRFIDRASRRALTVLDQIDVPLIRADGVLHIVELKGARIPRLVINHRNHVIVGPEVNAAVGQVMNYLKSLDEQRATILTELGIDCRRAFATVVIGDPRWVSDIAEEDVADAIRTYNSHLTRIEVITYSDLVRDSRRAIELHQELAQGEAE